MSALRQPRDAAIGEANGHERGKAHRRQLILATAREMIVEQGSDGLAIRAIAARAGISPVTVYNLFGSKYAVLKELHDEEYRGLVAWFEARASADPLIRLFDFVDLSTEYYARDLPFYKRLFAHLVGNSGSDIAITDWLARSANVRAILADAVAAGELLTDTPVDVIASIFIRIGKAISQEWVDGSHNAEQSRIDLGIAFHTILKSHCTRPARAKLDALALRYPSARSSS